MIIGGYEKLTLIDYPEKIATTVFTVGCDFCCPFCQNPELVTGKKIKNIISERNFFDFLKKRKNKLEGVCITGGEPLIQKDIENFIVKIKKMGFLVKLDTNGSQPEKLKNILDKKIIDFVAMDIKNLPEKYAITVGRKINGEKIKKSVNIIMTSGIDYEFRTTAVPGIHKVGDFLRIARWLKGAQAYYLQAYREERILDPKLKKITAGQRLDLEKIKIKIAPYFKKVGIRE